MASVVGVVASIAGAKDTGIAEQRARIEDVDRVLAREHITPDVAAATREYLRHALRAGASGLDGLPPAVRLKIARQRFAPLVANCALFQDIGDRAVRQCVAALKEDFIVKGFDVISAGDLDTRLSILLEGHATLHVFAACPIHVSFDDDVDDDEDEVAVAILKEGAVFGIGGFVSFLDQPWTIRARSLLRVAYLDETDRRELERAHPYAVARLRRNVVSMAGEMATAALARVGRSQRAGP